MASSYTSNYKLCQWEASDKVLRTEFNADNAKIDAALGSLASSVSGKASSSTVSSLQSTVNGLKTSKADKSALDSRSQTVSQHAAALSGKGNCQLYVTSYTGSGKYGADHPNRLTFDKKPMVVFVCGSNDVMTLIQGMGVSWAANSTSAGAAVSVTWSGNSVSWYGSQTYSQLSSHGYTYRVLALLQAG